MMYFRYRQLIPLLMISYINEINTQEPCKLEDGSSSHCVLLADCPSLIANPNAISLEKLKELVCGRTSLDDAKICCPQTIEIVVSTTTTAPKPVDYEECGLNSANFERPWYVSLYSVGSDNKGLYQVCQGMLISRTHVLTSLECAQNSSIRFALIGTPTEDDPTIQLLPLVGAQYENVGIIKLAQQVDFSEKARPICIPSSKRQILRHEFFVTKVEVSKIGDNWTQKTVPAVVIYNDICSLIKNSFDRLIQVDEHFICSFHEMSCNHVQEDSFLISRDRETSKHYLIGVGQYGERTCDSVAGVPDIRRNLYSIYNWIEEKILTF